MTIATNAPDLVSISISGTVAHPGFSGLPAEPYRLSAEGSAFLLPTFGGIVYNVSVGDSAYGWAADCIHPSVSICHADANKNRALNVFACVGNLATIMTGRAQGKTGVVTGKSGRFSDQVILHFDEDTRTVLAIDDQILVRSKGVGLTLTDFPDIYPKSLSPELFEQLPKRVENGTLQVGVAAIIPAHFVGAGAGLTSAGGSLHIQSTDREELSRLGLDKLRLGDLVAFADTDSRYNHGYLRGAMGIGVVGQTDGPRAGYGPGVTMLLTSPNGQLGHFPCLDTNITTLLKLEN